MRGEQCWHQGKKGIEEGSCVTNGMEIIGRVADVERIRRESLLGGCYERIKGELKGEGIQGSFGVNLGGIWLLKALNLVRAYPIFFTNFLWKIP